MSGIRFTAVFYLSLRGYKTTPIFSTIIYYIILNEILLGYAIKISRINVRNTSFSII